MNKYIGCDEDGIICDNCMNYYMSPDLCDEKCQIKMDDYHIQRITGLEFSCKDFDRLKILW